MAGLPSCARDLETSFLALYQEQGPYILRYLRAWSRNAMEAEDLHAETFCRAWHGWERFRGDDDELRSWLFRIARNLVIDRHRRQRGVWFVPIEGNHVSKSSDEVATTATDRVLLRALVGQMSGSEQELVALRVAGLSHAEIAKLQGRTEHAVKVAWHRTLQRLRGQLDGARPVPLV